MRVACASHVRAQLIITFEAAFVYSVIIECASDGAFGAIVAANHISTTALSARGSTSTAAWYPIGFEMAGRHFVAHRWPSHLEPDAMPWLQFLRTVSARSNCACHPNITAVRLTTGLSMATTGHETVLLTGTGFGFAGSGAIVLAHYGPREAFSSTQVGKKLALSACSWGTDAASGIRGILCTSSPGAGAGLHWQLSLDNGSSPIFAGALQYSAPILSSIEVMGSALVVNGLDFGPIGSTHVDGVWLFRAGDAVTRFVGKNCSVVSDSTTIQCALPLFVGAQLSCAVVIAGQASSAPTVSRAVPSIERVYCSPSACDALDTLAATNITIVGSALGPLGSLFVTPPNGGAALVSSSGSGPTLSDCTVTVPETNVTCSLLGGATSASIYAIVVTVYGQASNPSAPVLRFGTPVVVNVTTGGALNYLSVGGVTTVTVIGRAFSGSAALFFDGNDTQTPPAVPNAAQSQLVFTLAALPASAERQCRYLSPSMALYPTPYLRRLSL